MSKRSRNKPCGQSAVDYDGWECGPGPDYTRTLQHLYIKREAESEDLRPSKKARDIVKRARKSFITIEKAEELRCLAIDHETNNELTLVVNVVGVLLNNARWAKANDDLDADEAIKGMEKG